MTDQPSYRPLFVCGSPKSGTTWLQKVLDAHPQISCAGEGHFVEKIVNPMVGMLRGYNAKLKQVDERVYQGDAPYPPLAETEIVSLVRSVVARLMLRQKPTSGVLWVGDKTPRYTDGLQALRVLFPAARFIHVVRDPRDVAVSRLFHANRAGIPEALVPGSQQYYEMVRNAATAWVGNIRNIEAFLALKPANAAMLHEVRYEDLLEKFSPAARTIFAFLEVESDSQLVATIEAATAFPALSGRASGEEDVSSFFRKGIAGDWKNWLDDKALMILRSTAGALMRAHGYIGEAEQ